MKTIDIGCGIKKYPRAIGIDAHKMPGVDVVLDLENGKLPFATASIDSAFSAHTLEHIANLQKLIEEVHRVLKNKGIFTIKVPYFNRDLLSYDITYENSSSPFRPIILRSN